MAITSTQTNAVETTKLCTISHLDDAGSPAAASYTVGFAPRFVRVENVTDSIMFDWHVGMASGTATKTILNGTRSLEPSGGVTVSNYTIGFPVLQNKQYRVLVLG